MDQKQRVQEENSLLEDIISKKETTEVEMKNLTKEWKGEKNENLMI